MPEDTSNPQIAGDGVINPAASGVTSGGSGQALDMSGLQIGSGGNTYNINFSGDKIDSGRA